MIERRQAHHILRDLRRIKTWQLFVLLILSAFTSATLLRLNSIGMIQRRDAVIAADKAGDDNVTRDRLYDLQKYVSAHMNTGMGDMGVALQYSYNRDYQSLVQQQASYENPNGNIFKKVQDTCAPHYDSNSQAYKDCVNTELAKYPAAADLDEYVTLSADPYYHSYASPLWSPDFAGLSVLMTLFIVLVIIVRFISMMVLKVILRFRFRQI